LTGGHVVDAWARTRGNGSALTGQAHCIEGERGTHVRANGTDRSGPPGRRREGAGVRGRELGLVGRMAEGEGWLGCFSFSFFF
jgi:hypothetical protein